MKNDKTGEKRIKKVVADNVNNAICKDIMVVIGHGQDQNHGTTFVKALNMLETDIIERNKRIFQLELNGF